MRIGEIDDFWGINYCFLFTLAFVCKPRNLLCIPLTLPSRAFWAMWKVVTSLQVSCPSFLMWCLLGHMQLNGSAMSLSVPNLDMHRRQNLPSPLLCASAWYLKREKAPKRGRRLHGAVRPTALFAVPATFVVPPNPRITEIPRESWTFPPPQISYLYKHFLQCLSSHTAQELEHNSTEQTTELEDLWFLWVRLQVVFVPIKQWK